MRMYMRISCFIKEKLRDHGNPKSSDEARGQSDD